MQTKTNSIGILELRTRIALSQKCSSDDIWLPCFASLDAVQNDYGTADDERILNNLLEPWLGAAASLKALDLFSIFQPELTPTQQIQIKSLRYFRPQSKLLMDPTFPSHTTQILGQQHRQSCSSFLANRNHPGLDPGRPFLYPCHYFLLQESLSPKQLISPSSGRRLIHRYERRCGAAILNTPGQKTP